MNSRRAWCSATIVFLCALNSSVFGQNDKNSKVGCDKCPSNLLVIADTACTLRVDGQDFGPLAEDNSKSIGVDIGDHLVMVGDGKAKWEKIVHVEKPGQVLVVTELKKVQKQKAAEESKAEEDNRKNRAQEAALNNWEGRWVGQFQYDGFEGRVTYHRRLTVQIDGEGECDAKLDGTNDSRLGGSFSGTVSIGPISIWCKMVDERRIHFNAIFADMRFTYAGRASTSYSDDEREVPVSMQRQ